mmetsp:Transcript_7192/g.11346  ORF Transcript_7192/g.11346 Transcript_7192/m.11346 type:complete len:321 (-) Transcript_7192:34-996(-)
MIEGGEAFLSRRLLLFGMAAASISQSRDPSSESQGQASNQNAGGDNLRPGVSLTWQQNLLVGGIARAVAVTSVFPVDTIKTRLQAGGSGGLGDALKEGKLFNGYGAALASQIPYGMLVFGTYETNKVFLLKEFPDAPTTLLYLVAAVAGDLAGSLVLTPGEVLKQRVQAGGFPSILAALKGTLASSGPAGLYTGYFGLVARDLPFRAIQLPLYEAFKIAFADRFTSGLVEAIRPEQLAFLGAAAGMISAALTNPVDVTKTKLMTSSKKSTVGNVVTGVLMEQGIAGFAAGMPQRVGFLSGFNACFFIVYEFARSFVRGQN